MDTPDIAGQPAWVVILVVVLTTLGGAVGEVLRRRRRDRDEPPAEPVKLDSTASGYSTVTLAAMQHLADVAKRESNETEQARKEAAEMRKRLEKQLAEARAEVQRVMVLLAACNERVTLLGESDPP